MADLQQKYFDAVAAELTSRSIKPGLWARAISDAGSEDSRARAIYIRLRAIQISKEEAKLRFTKPLRPPAESKIKKLLKALLEKKSEPRVLKVEQVMRPTKRYSYEEFVSLHVPLAEFTPRQRKAMYEKWRKGGIRRMRIRKELEYREKK